MHNPADKPTLRERPGAVAAVIVLAVIAFILLGIGLYAFWPALFAFALLMVALVMYLRGNFRQPDITYQEDDGPRAWSAGLPGDVAPTFGFSSHPGEIVP